MMRPLFAFSAAIALLGAGTAAAQQTRVPVRVTVIQVAGSTIYVDAGAGAGLAEGMSVDVREPGGAALGSLLVLGVTDDRAGLAFQGRGFPITRGQALILELPAPAGEEAAEADTVGAPGPAVDVRGGAPRRAAPGGLRVAGTLGLELEAFRATSSWAEQVDGRVTQQLVRPALRFRGDVTGLPAGLTASADFRVWHRGTSESVYDPGTSLRVYRAAIARETGFLRFRAGRFWAPETPFSAYWDGALLRVGGGAGAGVAVGFTPAGGAEGLDGDAPKVAAFVDYAHRDRRPGGTGPEAWGSISFVQRRLPWEDTTVRSVGWTQRARWGPAMLSHRVEWEPGATDAVAHATVDVAVDLPRGARVTAGWLRDRYRPVQLVEGEPLSARVRERATVGASWSGRPGGFDVRGGILGGDEDGHSVDGTVWASPLRPGWPTVSLAGSYWSDADRSWLFVSPSLRRRFGAMDGRIAYHHYRIDEMVAVRLHGGDVSAAFPVAGLRARVGVQGEAGGDLVTLRLVSSLWLRF